MADRPLVLVVDNNKAGRTRTGEVLREASFVVIEAVVGACDLLGLLPASPDVVIIAAGRAEADPGAAIRRFRSVGVARPLAILYISPVAMRTDLAQPADGADGYLVEPVEPEELVATARLLLRTRRVEEECGRLRRALEAAERCSQEFRERAEHELKTALTALTLRLHSLRCAVERGGADGPGGERLAHDLAAIEVQVRRMAGVVEEVLGGAA